MKILKIVVISARLWLCRISAVPALLLPLAVAGQSPSLTFDGTQGYLAAFETGEAPTRSIMAQRYDCDMSPVGEPFGVSGNLLDHTDPHVAVDYAADIFTVVWTGDDAIFFRDFFPDGTPVDAPSPVPNTDGGLHFDPRISCNSEGSCLLTYASFDPVTLIESIRGVTRNEGVWGAASDILDGGAMSILGHDVSFDYLGNTFISAASLFNSDTGKFVITGHAVLIVA